MLHERLLHHVGPDELDHIGALLDRARRSDGSRAVSDHIWIDLQRGGGDGFCGVLLGDGDLVVGYAQASTANEVRTIEVVVDPTTSDPAGSTARLLDAVLAAVAASGGGDVAWWVADPETFHTDLARRSGLHPDRELLQMRRAIPVDEPVTIRTRPFRPGVDDDAWLAVNNRAFAGHGEQGGWDLATLRSRFAEPWFDPDGFLVLDDDGHLIGSCWTKVHADTDPPLGEIYVISVDPDAHGRGLGAQLTLAGLEYLASRGLRVGMLHVDAGNAPAVALYRRLGFTVHRSDRSFTAHVMPSA